MDFLGSWRGREDGVVVSPGVGGTSNSSSSSSGASWRSGTPSPPLSDEGTSANNATTWSNQVHASHSPKPGSTPDDGLLTDFFMLNDLHPRKKKVSYKFRILKNIYIKCFIEFIINFIFKK